MGLDMYLNKRTYVGNKYRKEGQLVRVVVPEDQAGVTFPIKGIKDERISEITEQVMYWRKANAIHQWFIDNCADGEGDERDIFVSAEKLKELLDVCKKVLKGSKLIRGKIQNGSRGTKTGWEPIMEDGLLIEDATIAKRYLPTQDGFFFGSTDYNEYYYNDVKETAEGIEQLLMEDPSADYMYEASW